MELSDVNVCPRRDEGDEGTTAGLGEMSVADAGGETPVVSGRGAGKKGKTRKKNFEDLYV